MGAAIVRDDVEAPPSEPLDHARPTRTIVGNPVKVDQRSSALSVCVSAPTLKIHPVAPEGCLAIKCGRASSDVAAWGVKNQFCANRRELHCDHN